MPLLASTYAALWKQRPIKASTFSTVIPIRHLAACAAGLATLDIFEKEDMFGRAKALSKPFLDRFFDLKGLPIITNMRGVGLLAAIDLAPDGALAPEAIRR